MTTPLIPIGPGAAGIVSPIERGFGIPLGPTRGEGSFGNLLGKALGSVNEAQEHKDDVIGAYLRGDPVELHDVMAAAEEATLSLDMLVETRNKLTDAYRAVMNMQV